MKVKLLAIICILAIVLPLVTVPVSAGTTAPTAIYGNPTSYASISLNETTVNMTPFTPGLSATNQSLGITVTCNEGFTITVADNTGRGLGQGYMGNYTSGAYGGSPLNTNLASPIQLAGTTNATASVTANTVTAPITTAQTLYTGTQPVNTQLLAANTFTQPVAFYDPVLPTGSTYRIDFLFTIVFP